MIELPEGLSGLAGFPGGADWLAALPRLAADCAEEWSLRLGEPYEYAFVSLALRVELQDGTPAVLKISFPHRESEHEPDALAHYDGRGAVRLLAHDRERGAMLLERAEPGGALLELVDELEAFRIAAGILERLWRPPSAAHPFRPIALDAARWVDVLPARWEQLGGPFERELLDAAVAAFRELPPTQGELVVCHQDFHRGNILRAQREPWLAIDPKPVVAERELDVAALIRNGEGAPGPLLDFLAGELSLDGERARRWALAHTLAWAFHESEPIQEQIAIARALHRLGSA